MNIQIAQVQHIDEIAILYRQIIERISELQPFFFKVADQDRDFIESTIVNDESDVLIAVQNETIVGFALIKEQSTPPYNMCKTHQHAYLMDLVVDSAARGQGFGTQLINACKDWARERNLAYLELSVLSNNTNAIKLYEKEQFQERLKTMYVPL